MAEIATTSTVSTIPRGKLVQQAIDTDGIGHFDASHTHRLSLTVGAILGRLVLQLCIQLSTDNTT
jgi:hypothetical protein